jgi:FAD/FMN-containing dehydrogenase
MNAVAVDPGARTATVGGGATMSQLDRSTASYGLATTGGRMSTTGVGGFILGGGDRWLGRTFGLACDNLLSVTLVTAPGRIVHASADENPELFWALHNGGGNFGVATEFTLRLHALSSVTAALLFWQPESGPAVLRAYRDLLASAPDELGGGALFLSGPSETFVPEPLVGRLAFAILAVYAGPDAEARHVAASMLAFGHGGALIAEMPYAELQCLLDDPPGDRNYRSAEFLDTLQDQAVDRFCTRADDMIVPSRSQHVLLSQGGAVARGPAEYPVPWRHAPRVVHPFGLRQDPANDGRARRWARDIRADLKPWASGAVYLNFLGDEGEDRVIAGFGRENDLRLANVKERYDPDNLFRLNHNIKPS